MEDYLKVAYQIDQEGLPVTNLFSHDTGDYPLILAQNEGFVLTNGIAMGAAGVINLLVGVEFAEAAAY